MTRSRLISSAATFPLAHNLTAEIWDGIAAGGQSADGLAFCGEGDLASPYPVLDLAGATFAVCGLAVSELLAATGDSARPVTVDRRQSAVWFDFPLAPSRPVRAVQAHGVHSKWMAEFQTADERWLRVQATYPTLLRRLVTALDCAGDLDGITAAVAALSSETVEEVLADAGAAASIARTRAEWQAHPVGRAVGEEPIAAVTTTGQAPRERWCPDPVRPLAGIRVLDFTRVVAGPVATRLLSALGAEVLKVDPPDSDEFAVMGVNDLAIGKRWAILDAKTSDGHRRLRELIASADVVITSHRADAFEKLGLGPEDRAALRPGLVDVSLNAYGWTGPWRNRRGFDTLVQYASGIADSVSSWANEQPASRLPLNALGHLVDASRPRHLPVEALDFSTGYLLAAAAIAGLTRRVSTGTGSWTRMSLARTAHLLNRYHLAAGADGFTLPWVDERVDPAVYDLNGVATHRLSFPLEIGGVQLRWDRPAERPGSSVAEWSVSRSGDDA